MFQRTRWSAVGAAVAVVFGAGVVLPSANAAITGGNRAVFVPITPCGLFDTRPGAADVGPRAAPLGAAEYAHPDRSPGTNGNCTNPGSDGIRGRDERHDRRRHRRQLPDGLAADASAARASNLNWGGSPPTPNKVESSCRPTARSTVTTTAAPSTCSLSRRLLRRPQPRRPLLHQGRGRRQRQRHVPRRGVRPVGDGVGATIAQHPGDSQ